MGFWVSTDDAPEVIGRRHDELGTANVTWIIRWREREQRNEVLPRLFASKEWEDIFSRDLVPRPVGGTDDAWEAVFSPDGQSIGLIAADRLKKVAVTGGKAVTLAEVPNFKSATTARSTSEVARGWRRCPPRVDSRSF